MFDYIRDHAIQNVWCTPDQDVQLIIEPARLTPTNGALMHFNVMWRKIALPDIKTRWHVFQIGQIHPLILGLFPKTNKWISFAETCNLQKMICDVYVNSGIQIPRIESFYMYNMDRDLIIAIKHNPKIPFDFNLDQVFLRLYSNEYFNSLQSDKLIDNIHVEGVRATSNHDIITLQNKFNTYSALPGLTYSFVNGYKVEVIDLINMKIGDVGEFVYDSSITKVIDFPIGNLEVFDSTLDVKRKYLLHYNGEDPGMIEYHDDIDFFIIDKYSSTRHRGVYYHRNQSDAVRMLTHRDYSVVVPYVLGYAPAIAAYDTNRFIDPQQLVIRLHVRKSGYFRPTVFDHNRIKELYKMNDSDVVRAMLGLDSVVNNWRAEVLEASDYTRIMRSKCCDITNEIVQYGYGYNAVSGILAQTPVKAVLTSSRKVVEVPYGLQSGSTAYEYDSNGYLLEYHYHPQGSHYAANNNRCALVEMISGMGSELLTERFGTDLVPISSNVDYRVYACKMLPAGPDNDWIDVTDTTEYMIENGKVKWLGNTYSPFIMVRDNNRFLAYDLELPMTRGYLKFSLNQLQNRFGTQSKIVMQVPMGEIDIILNGKSLNKRLDYFINFPDIVITNKEYLVNPLTQNQKIHIRFTGFCDSNFNLTPVNDAGFIEHGFLSNNNIFDIRDDKVLRIVVDGSLKHRSDLLFSEMHSGVSILNPINGKPYLIKDIVVPLKGLTNEDTYTLRDRSLLVDQIVSDYLTIKIPEPARPAPSAILQRYQIFSPFISKIIYDLKDNRLTNPLFTDRYTDNQVIDICQPYEYLLPFDPIREEQSVDSNFVIIHPHNLFTVIDLDLHHYRFIERVVKIYCNNLVNLSPFVRIKPI